MKKHPHNCARNCWRSDLCQDCEFYKPVDEANNEIELARQMFNRLKLKLS